MQYERIEHSTTSKHTVSMTASEIDELQAKWPLLKHVRPVYSYLNFDAKWSVVFGGGLFHDILPGTIPQFGTVKHAMFRKMYGHGRYEYIKRVRALSRHRNQQKEATKVAGFIEGFNGAQSNKREWKDGFYAVRESSGQDILFRLLRIDGVTQISYIYKDFSGSDTRNSGSVEDTWKRFTGRNSDIADVNLNDLVYLGTSVSLNLKKD